MTTVTPAFADQLAGQQWEWQSFANTNVPVGSWIETNPAQVTHSFVDDFGTQTSGSRPTNHLRAYTIRVTVPAP